MKTRLAGFTGLLCTFLTFGSAVLKSDEFFVNKSGSDLNNGRTREKAFLTIQKGLDVLECGDILTIGPGEYFERLKRDGLGGAEQETVIRAEIPGTVLLRGDIVAPDFRPLSGYSFIHEADFDMQPEAVAETDTMTLMDLQPNLEDLELRPGSCFYDSAERKLYISTSDLQPPARHHYTIPVTPDCGLRLGDPKRVILDGISVSGFYRAGQPRLRFEETYIWGIIFTNPENCVIRNCVVYRNSSGICLYKGQGNIVEKCLVYGNSNPAATEAAGIFRVFGTNDIIRECRVYSSRNAGIRYYLELGGPCVLRDNIAWGNLKGDLWIKTGASYVMGYAERCISGGGFHVFNITNSFVGESNQYRKYTGLPPDSPHIPRSDKLRDEYFADPVNLDFRPQSTSGFRGKGLNGDDAGPFQYMSNIFFVSPEGDDDREGTAVSLAWRTIKHAAENLKPGDTLYILPGSYEEGLRLNVADVTICGRGSGKVSLAGSWSFENCRNVQLKRLTFAGSSIISGGGAVEFCNCWFSEIKSDAVDSIEFRHCIFAAESEFNACEQLFLSGNIFSGAPLLQRSSILYSDYNSYPDEAILNSMSDRYSHVIVPDFAVTDGVSELKNAVDFGGIGPNGTAIGPFEMFRTRQIKIASPRVHSVSDTSVNIEWHTSQPTVCELAWGETPACENRLQRNVNYFDSFSLTGLKPSTKYYFRLNEVKPVIRLDYHNTQPLSPDNAELSFTTDPVPPAPSVFYVAPDGNDNNDGLTRLTAWRTVRRAGEKVNTGDKVLVAGGNYRETVIIRATGTEKHPIVFKALPGEKVIFDGDKRKLSNAFIMTGKNHVHFDGFYFIGYGAAGHDTIRWMPDVAGIFMLDRCDDITITRCMMNGQGGGYSPGFIEANNCRKLTVENCVISTGFYGLQTVSCPDLRFSNNVFIRNLIQQLVLVNKSEYKIYFQNNIITDSIPDKKHAQLLELPLAAALMEDNNCYYLRLSPEERKVFLLYGHEELGEISNQRHATLSYYLNKINPQSTSIVADPLFAAASAMERRTDESSQTAYLVEKIISDRNMDLDFNDLFATNPEVIRRDIGLQKDAFTDFWFNNPRKDDD